MAKAKQFIGSGKGMKYNGVMITLRMADAQQFIRTTENGEFLTFFIDPRKEADQWGRTHTAYVLVNEPEPQAAPVSMAAEPAAQGVILDIHGRKLRRISSEEAAVLRKEWEAKRAQQEVGIF